MQLSAGSLYERSVKDLWFLSCVGCAIDRRPDPTSFKEALCVPRVLRTIRKMPADDSTIENQHAVPNNKHQALWLFFWLSTPRRLRCKKRRHISWFYRESTPQRLDLSSPAHTPHLSVVASTHLAEHNMMTRLHLGVRITRSDRSVP